MRIALIECWFGNKPPYFDVWLNSLENNSDEYQFFLVTDLDDDFIVPSNLTLIQTSLEELKFKIEKALNKKVCLQQAYKICDYKPMFGKIFSEELKDYDFWGHTDLDTIYGKLSKFITKEMLTNYDIIFSGGHFSLYRNTNRLNGI